MRLRFVLVGVLLFGTAACTGGGPAPAPTPLPSVTETDGDRSPDGGVLRLAESGLTNMQDAVGKPMVSWGLVFENTSPKMVPRRANVEVTLQDAAGGAIGNLPSYGLGNVPPGGRAGIGSDAYVDRAGVAKLAVRVTRVQWVRADSAELWAGLTAGGVITRRDGDRKAEITFIVTSKYPGALDHPGAQAVFRDSAGQIVGGTGPLRADPQAKYPPGKSEGRIDVLYGIPPAANDDKTEVYLSPFYG